MPLDPPASSGAPDVVKGLRRQSRWTTAISLIALAVSVASLVVALLR